MNRRDKIVLTASVVLMGTITAAIGLVAKTALAKPGGPSPAAGGAGTRAGISYQACEHFELVDEAALRGWLTANSWRFLEWLGDIEKAKANLEPVLVDVFGTIFPECAWPPPPETTFGPQRGTWPEAIAQMQAMAGLEGSVVATDKNTRAAAGADLLRAFFGG